MKKQTIPALLVITLLLAIVSRLHAAHPLDDLTLSYPLPTTQELNNAAYGDGTYVMAGARGSLKTSTDLLNGDTGDTGYIMVRNPN